MSYKCEKCKDTGSLSNDSRYLDCTHCDAAEKRRSLNAWFAGLRSKSPEDMAWAIHQRAIAMAAAAPQVVADERATALWNSLHEVMEWYAVHGNLHHTTIMCNARAALAASPVQAQELDGRGFTAYENEQNRVITALQAKLIKMQTLEFQSRQRAEQECRRADELAKRFPIAPGQPVAVPEGEDCAALFNEERFAHMLNRLSVANRREGWTTKDPWKDREHLKRASDSVAYAEKEIRDYIVSLLAAQAAQGDAKEPTDADLLAAFNDILHRDYAHAKDYDLAIGRAAIAAKAAS